MPLRPEPDWAGAVRLRLALGERVRDPLLGLADPGREQVGRALLQDLEPEALRQVARERALAGPGRTLEAEREAPARVPHETLGEGGRVGIGLDEPELEPRRRTLRRPFAPGPAMFRTGARPFRSTTKYVTCSTATHPETPMATASTSAERVAKRRAALRAQGLRPVQIWVPDTRAPGFAEEYARQAAIADAANRADPELRQIEETVAADIAEHLDALETEQSG